MLENEVKPLVEQFLRDRGLQLSPEKTCITHIEQGFDFLGQNLRKFDGKLIIRPSKKNTHNFLEKVRKLMRQNRGASQVHLIGQLNPVIRGWVNYHRHIVALQTFKKVEKALWHTLWRWAKRRHPGQTARLDRQSILAVWRTARLGVCGRHRGTDTGGETRLAAAGLSNRNQNPASRQNPGGGKSARPAVARLL